MGLFKAKKSSISSVARLPGGVGSEKTSLDSSIMAGSSRDSLRPDTNGAIFELGTSISTSRFKSINMDDQISSLGVDLDDTKHILREQLKERRQLEQTLEGRKKLQMSSETEVRSCVERKRSGKTALDVERPRSSPSRLDSRTRVRLNPNDLERIRSSRLEARQPVASSQQQTLSSSANSQVSLNQQLQQQLPSSKSQSSYEFVKMVYVLPQSRKSTSNRARSAHPSNSKVKNVDFL